MRLVTIKNSADGQSGAIIGDEVLNFGLATDPSTGSAARYIPSSVMRILEGGDEGLAIVERLVKSVEDASDAVKDRLRDVGALTPYASNRYYAPVPQPRIVWSHGGGFKQHRIDMALTYDGDTPEQREKRLADIKKPNHPGGFFKNANTVIGDGEPLVLPKEAPDMVDWEMEPAFVIGRTCHNVRADEAMDYVVGHTLFNDVSARDWVQLGRESGNRDFNMLGKQFASFCPIGPCIATKDEVDAHDYDWTLKINGEVMQADNMKNSFFTINEIVAHLSQWFTLQPGDVLSRGTSGGVGFAMTPKRFFKPGDVLEMSADGIGTMRNPVVAA